MTALEWRDEFFIGIPEVDHEHQELIASINDILEQLGQHQHGPQTADCLGELYGDIAAHFALEESVMVARNYDEYAAHKADHEHLLDDIRDLMDELEDSADLDLDAFSARVSDWFVGHFSSHDARLHRHAGIF
jgi:hemerythrin